MLIRGSIADRVVLRAVAKERLLLSEATLAEVAEVLSRSRFDRYLPIEHRQRLFSSFQGIAEMVPILRRVRACRDPRDDKFLEVAVNGSADAILTGDADLLALHPFREITITTPSAWLLQQGKP